MPRNKKRNRQNFKTLIFRNSNYVQDQRTPYSESYNTCLNCGRNLEIYRNGTVLLCQNCRRNDKNWKNEYQPANTQNYLLPNPEPQNTSFESLKMISFEENNERKYADTWQRRIYFSNSNKPSNFNTYENAQEYQHQSELPITNSYRTLNHNQQYFPHYQTNSNCALLNTPSTSYPLIQREDNKRKRSTENEPSKRLKPMPYGASSSICQFNQLSENIMRYFRENIQTEEVFRKKMTLRSRLQQIIQKRFSGCGVFVFGSSMTGFATKTSDADLSLIFHDAKIVKNRVIRLLWELRTLFSQHYNFTKLQVINAKVSILKFQDNLSGFEVDLNINNPTGIRNSQLLRSYARLDDRVRPLVLAVKFWARAQNINDAKSGTLSSYCLGLMLIHYLQCGCNPPVLPSLQVLQPDKYSPNTDVRRLQLDEILPNFVSENDETVGQLFVGFLHYYSKLYNYEEKRISIRLGCLLPRVDKILTKGKVLRHLIDIEEPFEQVNTARAVNNPKKAAYIKSVFESSYNSVVSKGVMGLM